MSSPSTSTFLADSSAEYAPSEDDAHDFYSPLFEAGSDADGKAALHGLITSRSRPMLVNGKLVVNQEKKYQCTWKDCGKAYSKPSRLEEHERSHTGERPFSCSQCDKSYLRETHLHAHMRSHQPESEKSYSCLFEGCSKKFWTSHYLKRHEDMHKGAKPFKCEQQGCEQAFAKHHRLRSHFALAHCPVGTKPFICTHQGCTKSFATTQKLRAHSKTHEADRYICGDPTCPVTFLPTWTALQNHLREAHRPTCPYPSCNGRTFPSTKALRPHLKIHEDQQREKHLENVISEESEDDQTQRPPRKKRRRGGEIGRDFMCDVAGCDKAFKSDNALKNHRNVVHFGERKFTCSYPECGESFGYKHVMLRHQATHATAATPSINNVVNAEQLAAASAIDLLTGKHYETHIQSLKTVLPCPWPLETVSTRFAGACGYVFGRIYDVKRHLSAVHGLDVETGELEAWFEKEAVVQGHAS